MNKPTTAPSRDFRAPGLYQPGDGDVLGAVRPGSLDALELPSRHGDTLHYRDGRTESVE